MKAGAVIIRFYSFTQTPSGSETRTSEPKPLAASIVPAKGQPSPEFHKVCLTFPKILDKTICEMQLALIHFLLW
jgi:hypothetical protein